MPWDLVVFALVGFSTAIVARFLYPNRRATPILGSLVLGTMGSVLGGLLSWAVWPSAAGEVHTDALLLALLGAILGLAIWVAIGVVRRMR